MSSSTPRTSYDAVPYESFPYAQTHPDCLAAVATLLGLHCPRVERCRVLELGCAAGGNLIPMARTLSESSFVGVDLSAVQIHQGADVVRELGLKNIELRHQSIVDVTDELGKFDYIVCHGVYSWVPDNVQDKILEICARNLAPAGIAYVSYNTYPGWHMRGVIRDMMGYHARQFVEPAQKVKQARNLLDFVAKSVAAENTPYSLLLKQELEGFRRSSDSYLYHEHLEEVNEPIYFYQFVERAAAHGLRYLAEADLSVMVAGNYPPEIESVLQMLSQDHVHLEQYIDFLRNRTFRQTLLCHKNVQPNYSLRGEQLQAFHVASAARPAAENADVKSAEPMQFVAPDGLTLQARDPIVKAAMLCLSEIWPASVPFNDLVQRARSRLDVPETAPNADVQALGQAFLSFYTAASNRLLELHLGPPRFCCTVSERPEASALARAQAVLGSRVTSLRHESVQIGTVERHILQNLDGTRDRDDLVRVLGDLVGRGELAVQIDGQPISEPGQVREMIRTVLDQQLPMFARNALLVR